MDILTLQLLALVNNPAGAANPAPIPRVYTRDISLAGLTSTSLTPMLTALGIVTPDYDYHMTVEVMGTAGASADGNFWIQILDNGSVDITRPAGVQTLESIKATDYGNMVSYGYGTYSAGTPAGVIVNYKITWTGTASANFGVKVTIWPA